MRRPPLRLLATALTCIGLQAQEPPVLRLGTDLVHVGVVVTDRRGAVVHGLTRDDFSITEDGKPQEILQFATGRDPGGPELHAGLMLDNSESMKNDIEEARTAAIRFLKRLPQATDFTLIEFQEEVRVSAFTQERFPLLVERIRSGKVEGWTALYDAFALYLTTTAVPGARRVMVAFTDGGDSRSTTSYSDLLKLARASEATIHAVGFLQNQSASVRDLQQLRLRRIVEETGGQAVFPYSMKQIDKAFDSILQEIDGQYSLGYVSTNPERDGRWREVKVKLTGREHRDLRLRTRRGYYAAREPLPADGAAETGTKKR